jgi:hypothetical protein
LEIKKQTVPSTSSCEAEIWAMIECVKDLIYIKSMLEQLGIKPGQTILKCDNQSAMKVVQNEKYNSKTRHMGSKTAFIRHYIKNHEVKVEYIPTNSNLADGFTKALGIRKFQEYVNSIGLGGVWNKPLNQIRHTNDTT